MHWDLSKLYGGFDDPKLAADFAQAQALNRELAALLQEKPEDVGALLAQAVRTEQKLSEKIALVGEFIFLNLATNAKNEQALAWMDKLMRAQVEMQQTSSAFTRYVSKVEGLDALIVREPLLKEHEYMLKTMVKDAAHVMDPAIEGPVLKMRRRGVEPAFRPDNGHAHGGDGNRWGKAIPAIVHGARHGDFARGDGAPPGL